MSLIAQFSQCAPGYQENLRALRQMLEEFNRVECAENDRRLEAMREMISEVTRTPETIRDPSYALSLTDAVFKIAQILMRDALRDPLFSKNELACVRSFSQQMSGMHQSFLLYSSAKMQGGNNESAQRFLVLQFHEILRSCRSMRKVSSAQAATILKCSDWILRVLSAVKNSTRLLK